MARLHAEGKGRNDISRELSIPAGTVSNIAKRLGLLFDGSQVLMATEVRRREAADTRAALTLALLDDVQRLRERLFAPIEMIQYGGKEFERRTDELDQPTPQDQASLARSIGMLLDRAVKLDEYDRTGSTLGDAFNWMDNVTVVIERAVQEAGEAETDGSGPQSQTG